VFVLLGYFKDVEADRRTTYETLPIRFGRPLSINVSTLLCTLGLTASAHLMDGAELSSDGDVFWLAGALLLVGAHVRILPPRATKPIRRLHGGRGCRPALGEVALLRPSLVFVLVASSSVALVRRCRSQI
jgi:1,4-dihydroxy-2-naphthoate octaprenyltransferase